MNGIVLPAPPHQQAGIRDSPDALLESVLGRLAHRKLSRLKHDAQMSVAGFSAGQVYYTVMAEGYMVFDDRLDLRYMVEPRAAHYLTRHLSGDWGELPADLAAQNTRSLERATGRITSRYLMDTRRMPYVATQWSPMIVLTELDHEVTVFFTEEDIKPR